MRTHSFAGDRTCQVGSRVSGATSFHCFIVATCSTPPDEKLRFSAELRTAAIGSGMPAELRNSSPSSRCMNRI